MNVAVLRQYAVQLEEVAKLELAELSRALQHTVERDVRAEARAGTDADRYLEQVSEGGNSSIRCLGTFDAMEQAIAARKRMEQTRSPADPHGAEAKRTPGGDAVPGKVGLARRPCRCGINVAAVVNDKTNSCWTNAHGDVAHCKREKGYERSVAVRRASYSPSPW